MKNIFNDPQNYIEEIEKNVQIHIPPYYRGKSMAVVFLTKFCPVECPFCFFQSKKRKIENNSEKNEFSESGTDKLVEFLNYVNLETLEISGGGEPFENFKQLIKLVRSVKTDNIIIVTSGYWANNKEQTYKILNTIYNEKLARNSDVNVVLRLSVDKFHSRNVDFSNIENIIEYFDKNQSHLTNFKLKVHTMENDETIFKKFDNSILINEVVKNKKYTGKTTGGLVFDIDVSKMFFPSLNVNLNDKKLVKRAIEVFDRDIKNSPLNNFSIYKDDTGKYGLDFLINYSGNVSTWGNYQLENIPNIYKHSKNEILEKLYTDPVSYSFLTKNYYERDKIIREVNENAANRAIAINIRDYSGVYLLQERNTLLYYQIAIIKQYIESGLVDNKTINLLSNELKTFINMSNSDLKSFYNNSTYNIITQLYDQKRINESVLYDIYTLVKNGHYNIKDEMFLEEMKSFVDNNKELKKNQTERLYEYLNYPNNVTHFEHVCEIGKNTKQFQ